MSTPACSAASNEAGVLPGAIRSAPLWPTRLSLDPPIIVDASASWGEPGAIGRASMWWATWVRGRSVLAKGHGGGAPRESVEPGSALTCLAPVRDAVRVALPARADRRAAARARPAGQPVDLHAAGGEAVARGLLHARAGGGHDGQRLLVGHR